MGSALTVDGLLQALREYYGPQEAPVVVRPFEQVVWENVAYLVDDAHRMAAFDALRRDVGLRPEQILAVEEERLEAVAGQGILSGQQAAKLRRAAEMALDEFNGDLDEAVHQPLPAARRALQKFPGIGQPGADRILLFAGAYAVPALESNGLRVLQRLGLAPDAKRYATAHRAATSLLAESLPAGFAPLIEAWQLLRRHGQTLCLRTPLCPQCPLASSCPFSSNRG